MDPITRGLRTGIIVAIFATGYPVRIASQARTDQPTTPAPDGPISCWWRTDKAAVRIGEAFGLTLTCRVLETDKATIVPNVSNIEPTSLQLTPFEVVGGTRHEDIVRAPWRYVQFEYTVRLLGEEFFGRDIPIPPTNVTFRVQTAGPEVLEGTEQTYVLPSMPIRVLSLLPVQAADIREPSVDTLGDIESRRFQSTAMQVASAILFGFSGVLFVIAIVRGVTRFRNRGPETKPSLAAHTLLGRCVREVDLVRSEAVRDGWSSGLAGRALAPFRIAAATALSQPVTQKFVPGDAPIREGQLLVRKGLLRRRRALVSAAMTLDAIDRLQTSRNGLRPWGVGHDTVAQIREAVAGLSAVRYGRNGTFDPAELDRILETGTGALRRLRRARLLPTRVAGALSKSAALVGIGTWRH
ncbi:MAG: hypothetical protein ABW292_07905 [Vicinamibacterales bacterium]